MILGKTENYSCAAHLLTIAKSEKCIFLHNVDYSRTSCVPTLSFSMKLCNMDSSTHLIRLLSPCCAPTEMATSPPTLPLTIREPVRCICSMQGTGFSCPSGVGGRPPLMKVVTGDILVDITGRNLSEYLLYTSDHLRLHR